MPTLGSGGPSLKGERPSARNPATGPPGGQRSGAVSAAGTDEVTALRAQPGRRAPLAPAGGFGGRRGGGRERPLRPGTSAQIDWVKDETHTARQTDTPTCRHTDSHRPGKQPPSVGLGTHERQLDAHTSDRRQRGNSARGRGKQRRCSVASGAHLPKPQRGQKSARLRAGVGLQGDPRHGHTGTRTSSSFLITLGPTAPPSPEVL